MARKAADVVDAGTIGDTATCSAPHQYRTGIVHVLVNGVAVVERGTQTDARPDRVLRHKKASGSRLQVSGPKTSRPY